ncbi:TlpA family protein disulfide reductase [Actinokineospora xionganensis]|uniref:Thioredoxin family protein n=1 Tax=Actinokineospora xionganensis TaxID=2684470 RepID=A0ABR7L2G4_9PSEU|nr:thioredoxin family protein [Actinokineospora xionganensis]MBC6446673.1 thioredoxin family protein [Actinokineospora xionganensis]
MIGGLVAIGTLLVAGLIGVLLRRRDGRVRTKNTATVPDDVRAVLDPRAEVTLVQLSTTFCAPCRHARVILADLADKTDGLAHADIDLTDRPELAQRLAVLRTPTTLAVDSQGAEILRVGGVPRRESLLAALRPHLSA